MRLYTADEWQRMGWHGRARVRAARLELVAQLEAAHVAAYGVSHPAYEGTLQASAHVRRGVLNRGAAA